MDREITNLPLKISEIEKYSMLGKARTNKQRGLLCLMINKSNAGEWTRYSDVDASTNKTASKRMSELFKLDLGKFGIIRRETHAPDCNGRNAQISEFCIGPKQEV